jgi:spermidine synthase
LKLAGFRVALWAAFAASGATALSLQVVWIRLFAQVFGSTQQALASTTATFMGGLLLGALAVSRWGRATAHPLRAWAVCEAFVAAWALLLPTALDALAPVHAAAWRSLDGTTLVATRVGLTALLLVPPTTAMGASLPLLSRALGADGARGAAGLYAANALGAMGGAAATGFWLLPRLGLSGMTAAAVGVAVAVACAAALLSQRAPPAPESAAAGPIPWEPLVALFATGAATLALEVLASRAWALVLGAGGPSTSAVLVVFLLGLGVGAGAVGRRVLGAGDLPAALGLLVGVAGLGVGVLLVWTPALPALVWVAIGGSTPDGAFADTMRVASIGLLLPATIALGAAWPVALAVAADPDAARGVGRVVAANTAGNIAGALGAGFIALPLLGLQSSLRLLAAGLGLAAVVLLWRLAPSARRRLGMIAGAGALLAAAAAPAWDMRPVALGLYRVALQPRRDAVLQGEVLYHQDGASSSVTVAMHRRGPRVNLTLYTNGKPDATSHLDADTQILLGLVPLLVHGGAPERALVIGYGSGMTAGALLADENLDRVDVVELEPRVYEAADLFFGPVNGRPDVDPRVHRRVGDGRTVLLASEDRWDIVISEPPNPWVAGVADLFSADFYAAARQRLAPGGLFAQWVQIYELRPDTVRSIWATFQSVFPDTHAFRVSGSDLLLVGGLEPWRVQPDRLAARADGPAARALLARAGLKSPWDAVARYAFGPEQLVALSAGGRIATDDGAWLDHQAWRDLLGALDDRTASSWQREIGLAIADQGQVSALLAPLPPGPARGRTALAVATALVDARRWGQADRWREMAKAEGMDTAVLDAAFEERGTVVTRPPLAP